MNEAYKKAIKAWSILKGKQRLIPALEVDPSEILGSDRLHDLVFSEFDKVMQQDEHAKEIEERIERERKEDELKYNETEKRLLKLLGSIASYNDKGWQWSNDNEERKSVVQEGFGVELQKLLVEFGADNLTKQAIDLFSNAGATTDWQGEFQATAKYLLDKGKFYAYTENA